MGRPAEKPKDFGKTFSRLVGYLKPQAGKLALVALLAVVSVTFSIVSPRFQGVAMDRLKDAFVARMTLDRVDKLQKSLPPSLGIPSLDSVTDNAAKADIVRRVLDLMKNMPAGQGVPSGAAPSATPAQAPSATPAQAPSAMSPSASSRPAGMTEAQLADAVRA
ncbi:MAG TPA: hypothetical protein VMV44_12005, partial [Rectinemataceae bacterium]|nr:hypothetical protein [Rectinemataceae bacterium]